jgi:hypothetical protein
MVAEWCSLEDSAFPGRKAQWLTDAATSLKTMRAIKMVCYFDSPLVFPWWVDLRDPLCGLSPQWAGTLFTDRQVRVAASAK